MDSQISPPQVKGQQSASDSRKIEEVIEYQVYVEPSKANFFSIYRYATKLQLCGLFLSACCAVSAGAAIPVMTIFFGTLTDKFVQALRNGPNNPFDIGGSVEHLTLILVYIGIGSFVTKLFSTWGFNHIGDKITSHLRQVYLSAVLQQNAAYFDVVGTGEITSHMGNDMKLIQEGISQKMGLILSGASGFLVAIVITFTQNWYLAFIMLCQPVALILVIGVLGIWLTQIQGKGLAQYARVDNLAQEVLNAMRNIIAYRSQERFGKKYHDFLLHPAALETRERLVFGLMVASSFTILHWANGIGFWQAERLYNEGRSSIAEALTILYASTVAGAELGQAMPFVVATAKANNAAKPIFSVIDRVSPINALSNKGRTYSPVKGHIQFDNLSFAYPSRADQLILDSVDFVVPAGKTVALVGPSGSGKSTIFALLERLYLQTNGQILMDEEAIDELNLSWLRSKLGYVSQDVVLFHASIHENIAYGLNDSIRVGLDSSAARKNVIEAAKIAQIHSFIMGLPEDYNTILGPQGTLLSGGQKQRIAIARAIVSRPPILLLDEATAALDSQSEREVQTALEAAGEGRTTIVIAHRLSTVQNADKIIVMRSGRVLDQGTHSELMAKCTLYSELVHQQALRSDTDSDEHQTALKCPNEKELSLSKLSESSEDESSHTSNGTRAPKKIAAWSFLSRHSMRYSWRLSEKEQPFLLGGLICSVLAGISYPVHSIFFGNGVISIINPRLSTAGHTTNFWALVYFIYGIIVFFVYCARGCFFAVCASRLNLRARSSLFKALLQKDFSFFGDAQHSPGHLVGFLSSGVTKIIGVSGISLGLILENLTMLITGIIIGWAFGWKLGGVATATIPPIVISGYLQYYMIEKVQKYIKRDSNAVAVAHEGLLAMKTVAVLGLEATVMEKFRIEGSRDHKHWHWIKFGVAYACTSSLCIFSIALVFWYGGTHLIATGEYTIQQFYVCFVAVVGGSQAAAAMFAHAPDVAGASFAVERLKELMGESPSLSPSEDRKEISAPSSLESLVLQNINFRYPSRPTQLILDDVSLEAPASCFIALVGSTGSGKSSVINLVERFYTPESGRTVLGDKSICQYEPESYHRYLALVDQNTGLVGEDMRECLQSGEDDVSDEEIMAVLKSVSMEEFTVSYFPQCTTIPPLMWYCGLPFPLD